MERRRGTTGSGRRQARRQGARALLAVAVVASTVAVVALTGVRPADAETFSVVRRVSLAPDGDDAGSEPDEISGIDVENEAINGDGRFVAFETTAGRDAGLDPDDGNDDLDVYVRDNLTGQVTLISQFSEGDNGNPYVDSSEDTNDDSYEPVISANGRYVAFLSTNPSENDLQTSPTNVGTDEGTNVYWVDRGPDDGRGAYPDQFCTETDSVEPCMQSPAIVTFQDAGFSDELDLEQIVSDPTDSTTLTMSADGTQLAYDVYSFDDGPDGGDRYDIEIADLDLDDDGTPFTDPLRDVGHTFVPDPRTDSDPDSSPVPRCSDCFFSIPELYFPRLSADGDHLSFNWRSEDTHNGASLVSVYDRRVDPGQPRDADGNTRMALVSSPNFTDFEFGEPPERRGDPYSSTASGLADLSGDGLTVAYSFYYDDDGIDTDSSTAGIDLPYDTPQIVVVVRDATTGERIDGSERVISRRDGEGSSYGREASVFPVVSDDARFVAFDTAADIADIGLSSSSADDGCPEDRPGFVTRFPSDFSPRVAQSARTPAQDTSTPRCHVVVTDLVEEFDSSTYSPKLVDKNKATPANGLAQEPDISSTGRFVSFSSPATNLDEPEGTADGNAQDVYLNEWTPRLVATPDPAVFEETAVGASSEGSFTITSGDFGPFEIDDLVLLGPHDQDFTLDTSCVGRSFHAGEGCEVRVTFTPSATGLREADVVVSRSSLLFSSSLGTVVELTGVGDIPDADGVTELASRQSDGSQIEGDSRNPAISQDGRYVAFETDESLTESDTNGDSDIYVRDLDTGTTTLVSFSVDCCIVDRAPAPLRQPKSRAGSFSTASFSPTISADGRYIAFASADDKADEPDDFDTASDIFRVDRDPDGDGDFTNSPPVVTLISVRPDDGSFTNEQVDPSISADGSQVAWQCVGFAVEGSDCLFGTIYVRDLDVDGDGVEGGPLDSRTVEVSPPVNRRDERQPDIAADGDHVVFVAETQVGDDTYPPVVWVYDRDLDGDGRRDEDAADIGYQLVTTEQFTNQSQPDGSPRTDPLRGTFSLDPAIDGDGTSISYSFGFDDEQIQSVLPFNIEQVLVADRAVPDGAITATEIVSIAGPLEEIGYFDFDPEDCLNTTGFGTSTTDVLLPPNPDTCSNAGDGPSIQSDISADGRYVAFTTGARNLHVDDSSDADVSPCQRRPPTPAGYAAPYCDVLVADRLAPGNAGSPQLANPARITEGQEDPFPDGSSVTPSVSGDGRLVAFASAASNIWTTGFDDNDADDVFVREWDPFTGQDTTELNYAPTLVGFTSPSQAVTFSTDMFGPDPVQSLVVVDDDGDGDDESDEFVITGSENCEPVYDPSLVAPVPGYAIVHLDTPCVVSVAFRPQELGVRTAQLFVRVPDDETQELFVNLVGTGAVPTIPTEPQQPTAATTTVPATPGSPTTFGVTTTRRGGTPPTTASPGSFTVDPTSLDFGEQVVTVTSPQQTVTVTNSGVGPFRINGVSIVGTDIGDFLVISTDCSGRVLQPGQSCKVTLAFRPNAPGERSAVLRFDDDSAGSPHLVSLAGRAPTPVLLVNPAVTQPSRTVTVAGEKWAPNTTVKITMVDRFNPAFRFPETITVTTDGNGRFFARILVFPRSPSGQRTVRADGQPPVMTATDDLLVVLPSVDGPDFVDRG